MKHAQNLALVVPAPQPARAALASHLDALGSVRVTISDLDARWRHLQDVKQAEADARAVLAAITDKDAADLAAMLDGSGAPAPMVDHDAMYLAERELAERTREADVARALEPGLSAERTAANRRLTSLQEETPTLVDAVLVEEANASLVELEARLTRARALSARLDALRRTLANRRAFRLVEKVPSTPCLDVSPNSDDLKTARAYWDRAAALAFEDPYATFED